MAKVWPVYESYRSKSEDAWADIPLAEAISLFDLTREAFLSDSSDVPKTSDSRDRWFLGYRHIIVEVERTEGRREKWRPGFYLSSVRPDVAYQKLMYQALASELGSENVVDVKYEPTTDSQGNDALRITVIIAPDTTEKLAQEAPLAALVRLQERLTEMGEERTPIVEYATEAELAEDAST